MADRGEVLELLRIADLATQWPNLKPLHDHAMEQLVKISGEHAEAATKAKAAAKAKEEAEAAKVAAEAAKEAKDEEDAKEAEAPVRQQPTPRPSAFQPSGGPRG